MAIAGDPPYPLDAETREMIRLLREASARTRQIILNPPGKTDAAKTFAASRAAQLLAGYNKHLAALRGRLADVAARKVAGAYQDGLTAGEKQARAAGVAPENSPIKGGFTLVDTRRAQVLAQQTVGDLNKAVDSMQRTTGVIVKQVQAMGLDKAAVNRVLAGGTITGTPLQTLIELKKRIRTAAIDGKIVTVNTRTGVATHHKPDDYAELVFQTKLAETTNVATVHRLQDRGIFYARIIGSNSRNFCTAFVGRVFYTGPGSDPLGLFPSIHELPRGGAPFHPRCTKRYVAFIPRLATPAQIEDARIRANESELLQKSLTEAMKTYASTGR
jgi:hypothetical protein